MTPKQLLMAVLKLFGWITAIAIAIPVCIFLMGAFSALSTTNTLLILILIALIMIGKRSL